MHARRILIGLAVSALFIVLLLRQVSPGEFKDALSDVQPMWLVAGLAVQALALWVRGWRWRVVLHSSVPISTADATSLVVIGYAANNLLPARAGEVVRAVLLKERHGGDRLAALGTIVVERIFDGIVLALFLGGTVAFAGGNTLLRVLALLMTAGFLVAGVLLALLAARPEGASRRLLAVVRFAPERAQPKARAWFGRFLAGVTGLRGVGPWSAVMAATVGTWGLEAVMYWLVGIGFGLDINPLLYLGVCGAANLAIAAPSTSGGIGPFEFFAREVLVAFGVATAVGTAYALVLHMLLLVPVVIVGLALLWHRHIGLRAVLRQAEEDSELETAAPPVSASKLEARSAVE